MISKVLVLGHKGMVGSALVRRLRDQPNVNLLLVDKSKVNLLDQKAVSSYFEAVRPNQVYLAAARVGGIHANNSYPAEFIYQNLQIQNNVIHSAYLTDVENLLFLGSSCIYPKHADQPLVEQALLTGKLEPTNESYAIAKIAGIKMCEAYRRQYGCDFRAVMPTNLYGPKDNFHPEKSHVIPGLIQRFHKALIEQHDTVKIWGSGKPRREFLHVDDMASACLHVMDLPETDYVSCLKPNLTHLNVGTGHDCEIRELVEKIVCISGYKGNIEYNRSMPDGTPRKVLDISKLESLGWKSSISLDKGLSHTWNWYLKTKKKRITGYCFNRVNLSK